MLNERISFNVLLIFVNYFSAIIDTYSWVCFCLYAWNLVKTMHSGDGYVQLIFESSFIDLILVTVATFCITVFATGSNTDSVLNYGWVSSSGLVDFVLYCMLVFPGFLGVLHLGAVLC